MKLVHIHGPGDVRIDDVAEPEPGPRDAVVRVAACGICGSDLGYVRLGGLVGPSDVPMPIGHELSGVVEAVGSEVEGIAVGARVVLNPLGAGNMIGNGSNEGGFAPLVLVPNAAAGGALFPIPDDLPLDRAALAEPLGVGMQAVNQARVKPGQKVVVLGAGPIGLTATAVLNYRGIDDVIVADRSERRLAIARELGARDVINVGEQDLWARLKELQPGGVAFGGPAPGADAYIEATGHSPLIGEFVIHAKENARLSVVALHRDDVPVSIIMLMAKQLSITGSMAYPDDYTEAVRMLSEADLEPMITHRFSLDSFDEALAVASDPQAAGKVLVRPNDA